jgi:hypothetical protein
LKADGHKVLRSGMTWLCSPGDHLRARQVFAYCNISLEPQGMRSKGAPGFALEQEIQVAIASPCAGVLSVEGEKGRGGYLSIRSVQAWDPDEVVARLEPDVPTNEADDSRVRLLMLAGRRMTGLADVHAGLMPGWLGRTRGWWYEENQSPVSLLSMGICDATGMILGDKGGFLELFEHATLPLQAVVIPDHPLMPAAPVLLDQLNRTPAEFQAIAADLRSYLATAPTVPTHDDWMFAGAMLQVMQASPIRDHYALFGTGGSLSLPGADAILLSLSAEPQSILRHKKLGYRIQILRHHQGAAGPAMRAWLASAFEPVRRSLDDVRRDYETLIDTVARTTGGKIMVINRMSSTGHEDITSYAPFDSPMGNTLYSIASKEMNLVLHDIAETRDLAIIDVDAIAAQIGGREHLPDSIHQSGLMQTLLRSEILSAIDQTSTRTRPVAAE